MHFALVGNPNSGKTTLFNIVTGSTAHVGNWPGVTVDRKEGIYKKLPEPVHVVDLPGIYSLSPYSPEEIVARNYIINDHPDVIIDIVDATNIERSLYLTTQLIETGLPVVVALNMMDLVEKKSKRIDIETLEKHMGVPVVPVSALRARGVHELMKRAYESHSSAPAIPSVLSDSTLGDALGRIAKLLMQSGMANPYFYAVKYLENDPICEKFSPDMRAQLETIKKNIPSDEDTGDDLEASIANLRYTYITKHFQTTFSAQKHLSEMTPSDNIDAILTHRFLGIPIFLAMMFLVFHLTFSESLFGTEFLSPGVWMLEQMGTLTDALSGAAAAWLESVGTSQWAMDLVVDGLLAGLGAVLSFLPQIMLLFLFLTLLEDSGYMARAAFLMDRLLRNFGLSGKAFLPMLMGFGCSVPAMMATRTLEDIRDRRATILLMPCFSCGAKAPIWAMFAAALFPSHADIMIFAIYLIGIAAAIVGGIVLNRFVFKKQSVPFIMELPAYHVPFARNVLLNLWDKLKHFLLRASTIIAGATVVIWFLSNFDFTLHAVEANSHESILGGIGTLLLPIFKPLGFASSPEGWKAAVAILTGLIAKEMVVSTMGVLYAPGANGDALEDDAAATALGAALAATFSPLAALSFMVFNLLSVPCMAAVATAHAELKSPRWTFFAVAFWLGLAWTVSFAIFQIGSLLGIGTQIAG